MYLNDFEELLGEIAGDNPAGQPLDYVVKTRLDDDRKEIDPSLYDENDPQRPEEPKYADWEDIVELASQTLINQTKDLNLVARLVEAVTRLDGFPGLARALRFLLAYAQRCWEMTYPLVEAEEDLETRAGPFNWLAEAERGARFPTTIRMLPIVIADGRRISVLDWFNSRKPDAHIPFDEINRLMSEMDPQVAIENHQALTEAVETLGELQATLDDYMGPYAPSLVGLRKSVEECRGIAEGIAKKLRPAGSLAGDETDTAADNSQEGQAATGPGGAIGAWNPQNAVAARNAIYAQLRNTAELLIQLEPHSPIPYLIRKAVELGELSYPQLMARLVEDPTALMQIRKELGLPEE
jgi:type VI secretion system protein ImpA